MRLSHLCIERPVLATVLSIVIILFGIIAMTRLPNRLYPDVDPPVVSVTTVLPGAAPEVVETRGRRRRHGLTSSRHRDGSRRTPTGPTS